MLLTNALDIIKWGIENFVEILLFISIIAGTIQTWRVTRGSFWAKIEVVASDLISEVEAMPNFKDGKGILKRDYVVEQLLEKFGSKFSFITKKRLEKIIDVIVARLNKFSDSK